MSAPVTAAPDPAIASAWVAAFALGLAYSERAEDELVWELRAVTSDRPWLLDQAQGQLASRAVAEPDICRTAVRLLSRADSSTPLDCC